MPTPSRTIPVSLTLLVLLVAVPATRLSGQLIQIKTLPVADGEQWRFFPSSNLGMGGVSVSLRDSLLDPFENPADGARLSAKTRGFFFGSPNFYSVSKNAAGGRPLPIGGVVLALQQIDNAQPQGTTVLPPIGVLDARPTGVPVATTDVNLTPTPTTTPRQDQFAFATLGRVFESAGVSVGASAMWSGL